MTPETPAGPDDTTRLRLRLSENPGYFDPSTAFRIGREGSATRISSCFGVAPAAVAVELTRHRGGGEALVTPVAGLVGPLGVLPPAYDEMVMREQRNRSHALLAFLDTFGARIAELFFAAQEKYRFARRLRWDGRSGGNAFLRTLLSLTGFGTARLREQAGVEDDVLLRFAGFFAQRTRNAAALQSMLCEFTGLPAKVEQFRTRWLTVAETDRTRMDGASRLGIDAMAGTAVRDRSSGFRIVLGPLDYKDYLAYAPGGSKAAALIALTRLFVGTGLDFDIQVILKREQLPFSTLGSEPGALPRLGWNSWARIAPAERDSGDAIYTASVGERIVDHAA